jgi:hypothetical protein
MINYEPMIKFFRKIRQKMLTENKFSKYLIYAIGEIVLVMIGILLALQVNNWNEQRIQQKLEADFLQKVHQEFKKNQDQLSFVLNMHQKSFESCDFILKNYDNKQIPKDSMRKHLQQYKYSYTYNPSSSSVDALVNSGNLNIISNKELSNILIEWNEMVNDYEEEEIINRNFYDNVIIHFDLKYFTLFTSNQSEKYDAYFTFNEAERKEFLNIVAVKRRILGQIVQNPQNESDKLSKTLEFIISKTEQND